MKAQPISCIALLATLAASGTGAWAQNCGFGGFWNDAALLPAPRYEHTCTVVNGKIYVFGDYNHSPNNNKAYVYDPANDLWSELADLLPTSDGDGACQDPPETPGRGLAAAAAVGKTIYLFGGNNDFSNCWLRDVDAYVIDSDVWIDGLAPIPDNGRGVLTATALDGKIYVMGGIDSYVVPTFNDNFIYDPDTDTWSTGPELPLPRSHHAAVALNGKIYLIGGQYRLDHE